MLPGDVDLQERLDVGWEGRPDTGQVHRAGYVVQDGFGAGVNDGDG